MACDSSSTDPECGPGNGPHCYDHDPACCHCGKPRPECEHPNKLYTGSVYNGPAGRKTFLFYTCPDCKVNLKEEELDGFEKPEPSTKGDFLRCQCTHFQMNHRPSTEGGCRNCSCGSFKLAPEPEEPRCAGCGHPEHSGFCRELEMPGSPGDVDECGCLDDREPPLTPEEEEMVSGYEELAEQAAQPPPMDPVHILGAEAPSPPQPGRRPPYLLAYSVQGHLYEIALPGDAIVAALDGRLVITHHLGPVAGICQIAPITSEESTR